ncbi:MAG: Hsp70 family protein [Anaerolineae bacterium]|nr:Hsp70 family protein [Anaerolineae bacterium]
MFALGIDIGSAISKAVWYDKFRNQLSRTYIRPYLNDKDHPLIRYLLSDNDLVREPYFGEMISPRVNTQQTLMDLRVMANEDLGCDVEHAILAYSQKFTITDLQSLQSIALQAGYKYISLVPSATAIATAYKHFSDVDYAEKCIVCDIGASHTEITAVQFNSDSSVHDPIFKSKYLNVGGNELDLALFHSIFQTKLLAGLDLNEHQLGELIKQCREGRERLSKEEYFTLVYELVGVNQLTVENYNFTRDDLLQKEALRRTQDKLIYALRDFHRNISRGLGDISKILLGGGGSQSFGLQGAIEDELQIKTLCLEFPQLLAAKGAALLTYENNTPKSNYLSQSPYKGAKFIGQMGEVELAIDTVPNEYIGVWDVQDKCLFGTLPQHFGEIKLLNISSNSKNMIVVGKNNHVIITNRITNIVLYEQVIAYSVISIAVTNSSRYIAAYCSNGNVIIIDTLTSQTILTLYNRDTIISLAFSSDEKLIATLSRYSRIVIWDIKSKKELFKNPTIHTGSISYVKFDDRTSDFVASVEESLVSIWHYDLMQ